MQSGLIESEDFRPYLLYTVRLLADTAVRRKSQALMYQIWRYIDKYEFTGVMELCHRYGYGIPTTDR